MIGSSLTPATVVSYDQDKRQCRIEIDGLTTGSENYLNAEILYPIGDKGHHTEIEISKGDSIWVSFINGDIRYPIVAGYRSADTGNSKDWRKWHHKNIEHQADEQILAEAGETVTVRAGTNILIEAPSITLKGDTVTVDAKLIVNNSSTFKDAIDISGDVSLSGDLSSDGTVSDSDGRNTA